MDSKLILGTVQFGLNYGINNSSGKPDEKSVNEILDYAYSVDVKYLDTAEAYGDSQKVIGKYHKESANKFQVITKYSAHRTDLPADLKQRIEHNIETLGVDNLYCYMFHSFGDFESFYSRFASDILELKEKGLLKKFGVSVYDNLEIENLLNCEVIDVIQLPFNLLDNKSQRFKILEKARKKGVEIHTRSVYLQGLFFMKESNIPDGIFSLRSSLLMVRKIASENNISIATLALNYVYQQNYIDKVLIGVDNVKQLQENIKNLNLSIHSSVQDRIGSIEVENVKLLNPSNWYK